MPFCPQVRGTLALSIGVREAQCVSDQGDRHDKDREQKGLAWLLNLISSLPKQLFSITMSNGSTGPLLRGKSCK
jgi:hypothetical protein